MTNREFLDVYKNMRTLTQICEETPNLHYSNIMKGYSTTECEKELAVLCKLEILKVYAIIMEEEIKNNAKTSSL